MVGLMYYLKAEEKLPTDQRNQMLYNAARRMRDSILASVSRGRIWNMYHHPFMNSAHDPYYWVKHFETPLYACREYRPGTAYTLEQLYVSLMTAIAGRSNTLINVLGCSVFVDEPIPIWTYTMYLMATLLILDGEVPVEKKKWHAEVFLRDFARAAMNHGLDTKDLYLNAFMAVMAKMANKYLDPEANPQHNSEWLSQDVIQNADWWSGPVADGLRLITEAHVYRGVTPEVANKDNPDRFAVWQHNLPLLNFRSTQREIVDEETGLTYELRGGHGGPNGSNMGIGHYFIWKKASPYIWSMPQWDGGVPGWKDVEWADGSKQEIGVNASEEEYIINPNKRYMPKGWAARELARPKDQGGREHRDNQVEGAGLGLLFLRMLLTHINPTHYPKPSLQHFNYRYEVLSYPGVPPLGRQMLNPAYRFHGRNPNDCLAEKIKGDTDESLRIVSLGNMHTPSSEFVMLYADDDEMLKLKHGFVTDGQQYNVSGQSGIYLDSQGHTWKRFDKAEIAYAGSFNSIDYIVVAARLEKHRFLRRDPHWLSVSLWKVPKFQEGTDPNPQLVDEWSSPNRHPSAMREIDLSVIPNKRAFVATKTRHGHDRILVLDIDLASEHLAMKGNIRVSADPQDRKAFVTALSEDLIVYTHNWQNGWRLLSQRWDGSSLVDFKILRAMSQHKVLALTGLSKGARNFAVMAHTDDDNLRVESFEVADDGSCASYGNINTDDTERYGYLLGFEGGWERASIAPLHTPPGMSRTDGQFVIVGKGNARAVRQKDGSLREAKKTPRFLHGPAKGLKVLYGYVMEDGQCTLEMSNLFGSGEGSGMRMLDVAGPITDGSAYGVVTVHKTHKYGGIFGFWASQYATLIFWPYNDLYGAQRWRS